jgi:hypothetical protein
MAEYTGKNLYITFDGNVLTGDQRTFTVTETMEVVDASAGADVARTYLTTLEDGSATLELLHQEDGTVLWGNVDKGTSGTLIWAPEGTATGKAKHTVTAIVISREQSMPYDDVVALTIEFQFTGVVSDTTY